MSTLLIPIALILPLLYWIYHHCARTYTPLPLIGHLPWFALQSRQGSLRWISNGSDRFEGRGWKLRLPLIGQAWVVEDPACLKHILSTKHDHFGKGQFATSRMKDLFGEGIILTQTHWSTQRQAGSRSFLAPANLRAFVHRILPRHLEGVFELMDPRAGGDVDVDGKGKDDGEKKVDLQEVAYVYAMAVFGELAYHSNFPRISEKFTKPFDRSAILIHSRFFNPIWRWTERLTISGWKLRRDLRQLRRVGLDLVRAGKEGLRREEEGLEGDEKGDDGSGEGKGSGLLLRELVRENGAVRDETFLADSCLNFLTAGRDTTAQALSWTVFLLLTHPSTLERVTEELRDSPSPETYLASHALGDLTSSNDDSYCPFSNAVITESLRLHPPVPLEVHENTGTQPILLPDRTIVEPGEKVVWSPWAMARSTRIWGSDAASFKPERWLPFTAPEGERKPGLRRTAFEFPVFHAGPRSCLGKQLARIELIFILREVVRRYELTPDWDVAVDRVVGQGLTGPIEGGLPVRVRRRTA